MKWIPVTERLPEDNKRCLAIGSFECDYDSTWTGIIDVFFCRNTGWTRCQDKYNKVKSYVHVTHWTEFPEMPI